jgi:OOP family OmpA-OmpF porin
MDYQSKFFIALTLFLLILIGSIHAQVEEIPGAAQEMEEAVPGEPPEAPPAKRSAKAATSAIEQVAMAAMLYEELKTNGYVILEGIYFDKGKADLEMASDSCIKAIAQMLTDHPKLKIYVVSHTDNKGHMINQMRLSQQRSAAVMSALTDQYKIEMDRVFAGGVGSMCPIATNETEEGRAKNNRIELVVQ